MSDNLQFYWTLLAVTIIVIMSQTTFGLLFYTFFLPYGSYIERLGRSGRISGLWLPPMGREKDRIANTRIK